MEERKIDMKTRAKKMQIYLFSLLATLFLVVMFLNLADLSQLENEKTMENKNDKMNIINEGFYREDKHTIEEGFLPLTDEEKYVLSNGIVLTREYQMKVDSSLFLNRSQGIQYYIDGLYKYYKLEELLHTREDAETIRYQFNLNTKNCGKHFNLRIRNYFTGFMANKTTIDIKSSTLSDHPDEGQEKVFDKKFTPANDQLKTAIQKFEADVHPCHIKWSRESRVYEIPFNKTIEKCSEISELFPDAKSSLGKEDETVFANPDFQSFTWELEHTGWTKNGTKFKSAFTLQYDTYEEALLGNVLPTSRRGEWSMRTWSSNGGKGQWLISEILFFDAAYINALFYFGSPDLPCASPSPLVAPKFPLPHN